MGGGDRRSGLLFSWMAKFGTRNHFESRVINRDRGTISVGGVGDYVST